MIPPTKNWRKRRTNHRFYAEIVTDITLYLMLCTSRTTTLSSLCFTWVLQQVMPYKPGVVTPQIRGTPSYKRGVHLINPSFSNGKSLLRS